MLLGRVAAFSLPRFTRGATRVVLCLQVGGIILPAERQEQRPRGCREVLASPPASWLSLFLAQSIARPSSDGSEFESFVVGRKGTVLVLQFLHTCDSCSLYQELGVAPLVLKELWSWATDTTPTSTVPQQAGSKPWPPSPPPQLRLQVV